jgi:hypothetical protein
LVGFLDRDRVTQAIIAGNGVHYFAIVVNAGAERDGSPDERPRHAEAATKALGYPGCHRFISHFSR